MKNLAITLGIILISQTLFAQRQDFSAICREKMKALDVFSGQWEGTGTVRSQGAEPMQIRQKESVMWQLNGTLLQIEGKGFQGDSLVFHAIGQIAYHAQKQSYTLRSYTKEGLHTDAYFHPKGENQFEWGFDIPGGKIRYNITFTDNNEKWTEEGAFSHDGNNWYPFINMELKKMP